MFLTRNKELTLSIFHSAQFLMVALHTYLNFSFTMHNGLLIIAWGVISPTETLFKCFNDKISHIENIKV